MKTGKKNNLRFQKRDVAVMDLRKTAAMLNQGTEKSERSLKENKLKKKKIEEKMPLIGESPSQGGGRQRHVCAGRDRLETKPGIRRDRSIGMHH